MTMTQRYLHALGPAGFHRLAYTEWGDHHRRRVMVCVHGLTRTGRDFDALAQAFEEDYRVVCPDVVGRGRSDWLSDPTHYQYPLYLSDMVALIARLDVDSVDWVGTSMGGLIGMLLAAQPNTPIRRLVLNDIGPYVPGTSLASIATYLGKAPDFPDLDAAADYLSHIHNGFGPLTRDQWQHMAEHSAHRLPEGGYRLAYDPDIAQAFGAPPQTDVALWEYWDRIDCPVLVLRGGDSDLLRPETVDAMRERGPASVETITFRGVGHAPALMASDQIKAIRDWLNATRVD